MSWWPRLSAAGRWGVALAGVLGAVALFAGSLSPFDPERQVDPAIASRRPPGTTLWEFRRLDGSTLLADSYQLRGDRLELVRRDQVWVGQADELAGPRRRFYLLGTDRLGRDMLSRILFGSRTSLAVGCLSVALALSLGITAGGIAAISAPWLDSALMRFVDGLLAFPQLLLLLTLALLFEPSTTTLIVIIGGTGWMGLSRLVRAELRRIRGLPFVHASRGLGAGPIRVFTRHLLPNAWAPILATASLMVGDAILVETALSFLGLGVAADLPSWGRMIADGRADLAGNWWISAWPGLAVVATVLVFHLISDGLREVFDPHRRSTDARSTNARSTNDELTSTRTDG